MKHLFLLMIILGKPALAADYFPSDYEHSKKRFINNGHKIQNKFQNVVMKSIEVGAEKLTMDTIFIPAQKTPQNLIIISSGNHGVEAYAGSAMQSLFIKEILKTLDLSETGVLLIHAMNPWGFKYHRRGTENNVNLNRNFDLTNDLFAIKNPGYTSVREFIEIPKKVMSAWDAPSKNLIWEMLTNKDVTRQSLTEAISKGQYEYARGLNYGGNKFETQTLDIISLLREVATPYRAIFSIDMHTGLGDNGVLHLMPEEPTNAISKEYFSKVFKQDVDKEKYDLTLSSREGFYEVSGDYTTVLGKLFPGEEKIILSTTAEFGTMGNGTLGKLVTINRLILENQGYYYGYANEVVQAEVRQDFKELFFPESKKWRSQVLDSGKYLMDVVVKRFISLTAQPTPSELPEAQK